ncbi:camp-binding domain-like protein [Rhizoclosmatium globosum]|uniref:Camp-binding domain-like protein n=1 Tax=Rhizoclosmatium globosum TaxID=329046 RepID=A0A1Y2ATQ1_9FUNG|nr:camp-binding domain-like protein [Rhizoclosmatium globosum]|eukprot:ORY25670.1 camp-binding domain-like protein [Rhizoclosmatium globosum]
MWLIPFVVAFQPPTLDIEYLSIVITVTIYFFGRLTGFVGWSDKWTEFEDADLFDFYAWTLYRAVGNMFPAAFDPQTPIEQLIQTIYVIISAVIYAVFLGAISSATMSINPSGKLYQHKMEQLNDYVKWKNLSTETELKLFSYYETKYRGKFFEEESLLSEMNESLRAEISLQNTRALLERVPFLKRQYGDGRDEIFLGRLAMALRPQYYVTGDYITKQGDSGHDMFFILHGKVDVSVNGKKMVSLFDGAYIGGRTDNERPTHATVQAAMPSILYRLNYNDFHDILDEFLDMKMRMKPLLMKGRLR